jgi:3-oxoacyl-[acyl-carrier protein] reductase
MNNLNNKVAMVTGGGRGIGAAIAKRLALEGASVAITYNSSPAKAEQVVQAILAAGGKGIAICADSGNAEALRSAVAEVVKAFGGLDILVNNAGLSLTGPLDEFSLADFDRMLGVNVRGVYIAIQEASRHMGHGGRIINIGSCVADRMPFPGAGPYTMTKAAVAGLTRGLARELGPRGITINNIQPGPTDTDMNPADGPSAEVIRGVTAVGRHGHADEIAAMVAYLAAGEAGFVTGASLTIDGGFAA